MKVVVTGASGNAGTGLLRALRTAEDVTEVVGIARRVPRRTPAAPYDIASWVRVDVGARSGPSTIGALANAFAGADAVVHLAWEIQPTHDRQQLWRTNVLGTERVLEAARAAGVGHVVIASSVGAYTAVGDDVLHSENWHTGGIPSSDYSVDKAEVERMLDAHERQHPDTLVTRVRPGLIFQRDAGSQLMRYFVGPLVPPAILRGRVPVLPWPKGLRLQAVHADDLGQAYLAAVRRRPGGAVNIAAEGVVRAPEAAEVLSSGRWRHVSHQMARAAVTAGWKARAIPVGGGWLDMGTSAPLMATQRATDALGWTPTVTAADALAELVAGMADGAGTASPPMRPRRR